MSTPYASTVSENAPLEGQDNRSGNNFQLLSNYGGGSLTVSCPTGLSFNIMQDKSAAKDPTPVQGAANGTVISGNTLVAGNNYYIANPANSSANFVVTLNG